MEIVCKNNKKFTKIFENLKDTIGNTNIQFNNEKICILTIDDSHVSLVNVEIKNEFFDVYNVKNNITIGFCIKNFIKILKNFDEEFTLSYEDDKILISSKNKKYKMTTLYIDDMELEIPDVQYSVNLEYFTNDFLNIIKDISIDEPENLEIIFKDNKLYFESNTDSISCSHIMETNDDILEQFQNLVFEDSPITKNFKILFSMKYIKSFIKFPPTEKLIIQLSKEYPLNLIFKEEDNKFNQNFYLAPKIEEEEEEY